MPVRPNISTLIPNKSQAQQLGLQDAARQNQFRSGVIDSVGQDMNQIADFVQRKQMLNQLGGQGMTPQEAMQNPALQNFMSRNPQGAQEVMKSLGLVDAHGVAAVPTANEMAEWQAKEDYKNKLSEDKDRRDEMRGRINERYASLDKSIAGIDDNQKTVRALAKAVYNGNRNAVSNLMVKLVKSSDENSAVLAGEMLSAMNIEGFKEVLAGGNFDPIEMASAVKKEIAALSPESVNLEDILEVANINKQARLGSIQDSYNMALEERALLPEAGQRDTFSKIRDDKIKSFTKGGDVPIWFDVAGYTEKNITSTMNKREGMTREQAIEALALDSKIRGGRIAKR